MGYACPMTPLDSYHDQSSKSLLNGLVLPAGQTAQQDLDQALDNVFNDSNVPPFVCRQLIQHLVTSAPSPAYVARVSNVFVNDGTGVRGNLKAVISAILLDPEARANDDPSQSLPQVGHLREPTLWQMNVARALTATPKITSDQYSEYNVLWSDFSASSGDEGELLRTPASVFNFFSPSYMIPGSTTPGPEFQLESTASIPAMQYSADSKTVFNNWAGINIDLSASSYLGQLASADPSLLVEQLNVLFLHGTMPPQMRSTILSAISGYDPARMARMATYLVITSPNYRVIQ
jgi:hypothetical protein